MLSGNILLAMTFASCLIALAGYSLTAFGKSSYLTLGIRGYRLFAGFTAIISGMLLYFILTHNFQLEYVNDYSSTDLSFLLLFSTFWAGQVGTFLLWLLFTTLIGFAIYKRKDEMTPTVMFYYLLGALFLMVLLAVRSPFRMLPSMPVEGRGLNPLLQNFWMIIHPPVVFIGFALMAVPFSYALAALTKNNYEGWASRVFPWVAMSSAILGLGIFLGGYWAYETLGWGGYWAWDPVENASLIPWLTNLALLHGLLIERKKGQLRKTNLLLAAFGFLLVVYGTFLTRSGVLADFSVHSFTDLGTNAYLVSFLLLFVVLIGGLMIYRFKSVKTGEKIQSAWSSDFFISLGLVLTSLFALLVLIGTSSPLITRLPFFESTGNVSMRYYTNIALPIGILMALTTAIAMYLRANGRDAASFVKKALPSFAVAVVGVIVAVLLGVSSAKHLILVFGAVFVAAANLHLYAAFSKKIGTRIGSFLAHFGFGVILIGFLATGVFATSKKAVLMKGEPGEVMGYKLTYTGMAGEITDPDNAVQVTVNENGKEYGAQAKLYYDEYNRGLMREPYVRSNLLYDLYIAPEQVEQVKPGESLTLSKDETGTLGEWTVQFEEYDLGAHGEPGEMKVGALIYAYRGSDTVTVTPSLTVHDNGTRSFQADTLGVGGAVIYLDDLDPSRRTVSLRLSGAESGPTERLIVEVSEKPLILLVWVGAILIITGSLMSWYHRKRHVACGVA